MSLQRFYQQTDQQHSGLEFLVWLFPEVTLTQFFSEQILSHIIFLPVHSFPSQARCLQMILPPFV